jgi:hypothetical protein
MQSFDYFKKAKDDKDILEIMVGTENIFKIH